jgi:tRNA(Ile)-lysidine synthetase-like protein
MYLKYNSKLLSKGEKFILACSGGPDSMAALNFLTKGGHARRGLVVFINHGTLTSLQSYKIVKEYCKAKSWRFISRTINIASPKGQSQEEYWRNERYRLFGEVAAFHNVNKIITAHHLDDAVETYIFNALNGKCYTIPEERELLTSSEFSATIIRPFMENTKQSLLMYCQENNIDYFDDPTNHDGSNMRSYIRKNIVQNALYVNPGLHKVVLKNIKACRLTKS